MTNASILSILAHATPTPTSRSKGQKSKSRGAGILWRPPSRTACLWLPRLDMRRVRCDMIDTFKIMNSIYDVHMNYEGGRRGHEKKLFKKDLD